MLKEIVIGNKYLNSLGKEVTVHSKVLSCIVIIQGESPFLIPESEAIFCYKEVPKKLKRFWIYDVKDCSLVRKCTVYLDENGYSSDNKMYWKKTDMLRKYENEFIDVDENGEVVYE